MGGLPDILEGMRRECMEEEGLRTERAMDRVLILRRIEALVRTHARRLVSVIREEQLLMTPECLENLPMCDETEEMEWLREMDQLIRIRDPAKTENIHGRFGTPSSRTICRVEYWRP
jgi:hypothetical protein